MSSPPKSSKVDKYTTKEVQVALNNCMIAVSRWDLVKDLPETNKAMLRGFSQGLVELLGAELAEFHKEERLVECPAEIVLVLVAAATLALFREVLPEDQHLQNLFTAKLVRETKVPVEGPKL